MVAGGYYISREDISNFIGKLWKSDGQHYAEKNFGGGKALIQLEEKEIS